MDLIPNITHIKFLPGRNDKYNKSDIVVSGAQLEQLDDEYFFGPKAFRDVTLPNFDQLLENLREDNSSNTQLELRNTVISLND